MEGSTAGLMTRGVGAGSSSGPEGAGTLISPSSSVSAGSGSSRSGLGGTDEMDATCHNLTSASVPQLSTSWSWNRLYAADVTQCECARSESSGPLGLRRSQKRT